MPKRKPVDVKRVPLNCLVLPETFAWLKAQSSQGKGVDIAVGWARSHEEQAAYYEAHRRQELERQESMVDENRALAATLQQGYLCSRCKGWINGGDTHECTRSFRAARPFKGPLLKPKERK